MPRDGAPARRAARRGAQGQGSPFTQLAPEADAVLHDCCEQPRAPRE